MLRGKTSAVACGGRWWTRSPRKRWRMCGPTLSWSWGVIQTSRSWTTVLGRTCWRSFFGRLWVSRAESALCVWNAQPQSAMLVVGFSWWGNRLALVASNAQPQSAMLGGNRPCLAIGHAWFWIPLLFWVLDRQLWEFSIVCAWGRSYWRFCRW